MILITSPWLPGWGPHGHTVARWGMWGGPARQVKRLSGKNFKKDKKSRVIPLDKSNSSTYNEDNLNERGIENESD